MSNSNPSSVFFLLKYKLIISSLSFLDCGGPTNKCLSNLPGLNKAGSRFIESTLNEAVMCSLIRGGDGSINIHDVDEAAMKLRESGIVTSHQSVHDRRIAAVHEAGHALVASYLGYGIAKISIFAEVNLSLPSINTEFSN